MNPEKVDRLKKMLQEYLEVEKYIKERIEQEQARLHENQMRRLIIQEILEKK